MRLMYWGKDGGPDSTVWGFWPIEIKSLFSVALLKFENGTRECFHTHAFNAISWVLKGELYECFLNQRKGPIHRPSWKPILTKRTDFHKVISFGRTWVLTFRGPWVDTWFEFANNRKTTLTHGRKII